MQFFILNGNKLIYFDHRSNVSFFNNSLHDCEIMISRQLFYIKKQTIELDYSIEEKMFILRPIRKLIDK